jgi:lysophospholipase L1-like esterase
VKDFKRLLDLFKKDGIPVLFVMCPENIPGRNAPQFDEKNANLVKISKEYGISFLNYNTDLASEINDDYKNYSDWGHLNTKGSTLFSQKLGEDITEYLP